MCSPLRNGVESAIGFGKKPGAGWTDREGRALLRQQAQLAGECLLFFQFSDARIDLGPAEVIEAQALDYLKLGTVAAHGEGTYQAARDAIAPFGTHTHTVPVTGRRDLG